MAEVKDTQAKKPDNNVKVTAVYPPFDVIPTGQIIKAGEEATVVLDGWIQANIDKGLLSVCK